MRGRASGCKTWKPQMPGNNPDANEDPFQRRKDSINMGEKKTACHLRPREVA